MNIYKMRNHLLAIKKPYDMATFIAIISIGVAAFYWVSSWWQTFVLLGALAAMLYFSRWGSLAFQKMFRQNGHEEGFTDDDMFDTTGALGVYGKKHIPTTGKDHQIYETPRPTWANMLGVWTQEVAKRQLTKNEIAELRNKAYEEAKQKYPKHMISVTVEGWTDDDGNPIVRTVRGQEIEGQDPPT
jgi:hypothetical protein